MTHSPPTLQGFELAVDASVVQHFWRGRPTRLTMDTIGVRIDYGLSRSRVLRWDNHSLQFALLDFRDARRNHAPGCDTLTSSSFVIAPSLDFPRLPSRRKRSGSSTRPRRHPD